MSKLVTALVLIGAIAFGALHFLLSGHAVPKAHDYVQGIDVSHHQGPIDWQVLYGNNVSFAFIKATEGATFIDPRFKSNWKQAGRTPVLRGAYHFFTQCRSVELQAANYINVVGDLTGSLPPVLDLEHMGPCREGPTMARPDLEVVKLMDILEAEYGSRPIIYTTQEFHDAYLIDLPSTERFWIRSIFTPPRIRKNDWLFWQHHHKGKVDGIKGPVDLNAFKGTEAELEALRIDLPNPS